MEVRGGAPDARPSFLMTAYKLLQQRNELEVLPSTKLV